MASEKIQNILEEIKALSLLEANELKNAICEEFGVSADAPVMVAGAAAPAAEATKDSWDVVLVGAGEKVYLGQVVGSNPKGDDIVVNVCKKKQLTNTRSSSSDEALKLTPIQDMSLEGALEFIADDELVEVTPKSIRIRKQILDHQWRAKSKKPVVE